MTWLDEMQAMQGEWATRNFPCADRTRTRLRCALGVAEEAGELAHAILKMDQGIRGDNRTHIAAAKDALGDVIMYALHLCYLEGWSLETIIRETSSAVLKRDWIANPEDGGTAT